MSGGSGVNNFVEIYLDFVLYLIVLILTKFRKEGGQLRNFEGFVQLCLKT